MAQKLTEDEKTTIHYSNTEFGDTQEVLASRYNVSQSTISKVVSEIESEIEACMKIGRERVECRKEVYKKYEN